MASKANPEPSPTPKLLLFSLPNQVPEPPGMLTPPLRPPSSIPFLWEEAPGKPRTTNTITSPFKSTSARCLELPPRLLSEAKTTNTPSPTTVLDGPCMSRSASYSTIFARESKSLASFEDFGSISKRRESKGSSGYFGGSFVRKSCKRNTRVCEDMCVISPNSSSFSGGDGGGGGESNTKVKITRIRRTGSFFSRSHHSHTNFLASIYGTFKQVVPLPWRSRKTKKDGLSV